MPPGQSSHVDEVSSRLTEYYDTVQTSRRTATLRPQYKGTNDPRQPVCPAGERPATQSDSNITSVGAPGCRTPTDRTVHVVLCNATVVPRSHSCVGVCCCYPRPDRWCSPQRDRHPASSPFSQTSLGNCCFRLSESVDESPRASSTTQLIIPLPTQPV